VRPSSGAQVAPGDLVWQVGWIGRYTCGRIDDGYAVKRSDGSMLHNAVLQSCAVREASLVGSQLAAFFTALLVSCRSGSCATTIGQPDDEDDQTPRPDVTGASGQLRAQNEEPAEEAPVAQARYDATLRPHGAAGP
jgi:hypothetical protein